MIGYKAVVSVTPHVPQTPPRRILMSKSGSTSTIPPDRFYSTLGQPIPSRSHTPSSALLRPQSTSIAAGSAGIRTNGAEHDHGFRELAHETNGLFLGPMPLDLFLASYLSPKKTDPPMPPVAKDLFIPVTKAITESGMYQPIVSASQPFATRPF
jgi:hypothetical protein